MSHAEATCTKLNHPSKLDIRTITSGTEAATSGDRVQQLEQKVEQLQLALAHRPPIEHVLGMVMLMTRCDEEAAFATLSRISQNSNRKVHDLVNLIRDFVAEGQPLPPDVAATLASIVPKGRPRLT